MAWRTNPAAPPDRSIWLCPANKRRSNGRNLFHYCLNEHINGTGAEARPVRLGALKQPSVLVWLFDTKNLPAVGAWSFVPTNLHNAGAQFLFLDGHVARIRCTAYWDFERDRARTDHPSLGWWP
jgi:prepilin-type processing-associated H-X9-DG protein